jgi:hypothetical protein
MTFPRASASPPDPFRLSPKWDIYVPFSIAAVPAGLFALLGLATKGLEKPRAEAGTWVIIVMIGLQILGIIAMSFVILMRFERSFNQLSLCNDGNPATWRRLILFCSIVFVVLYELLTNIAAGFAGAGFLLVLAAPAFIGYICCLRLAFARL